MAKNWAICVGINNYDNMPTLQYAQRDAELMRDYFLNEAGFEKVYLFTDNSPEINDAGKPFKSQPTYGKLRRFLQVRFNKEFLSAGDNFWFFYSGHGMRFKDRDYLMPADANPHPDEVKKTAISLYEVTERLRRCGADNVILFLDACRSQESSRGLGIGKEKQKGVITFFSCSPNERSYEIEDERIQQGSFTYALLESLRIKGEGNCATVERLDNRLGYRVSDMNRQFGKPQQTPYAIVEPATKSHLILLEKQATEQDIATLREEALEAENEGNLELAEQLWTRVLALSPANEKALKALRRIWQKQDNVKLGTTIQNINEQKTESIGNKAVELSIKETDKKSENDQTELLYDKNSDMDATDSTTRLSNGTNYSKSGGNQPSNHQGQKSTRKKVANKNQIQSTTNTFKFSDSFVASLISRFGSLKNSSKSADNQPYNHQDEKSVTKKVANKNQIQSTTNTFKKIIIFVASCVGVGVLIGIIIGVIHWSENAITDHTSPFSTPDDTSPFSTPDDTSPWRW